MVKVQINEHEIYLDGFLKDKLDNVIDIIQNKNYDAVFLIDGDERIGKSTLGMACAFYISNGNFSVNNICIDSDDAIKKIETLPDKSVLMIDEGSLIFSSRDSMRQEQKKLIKIMNVCGQKNMVFIVILPCFFDLNRQIAVRRSRFLLHCYSDEKLNRGRFAYFGKTKKKYLYEIGKKNYDSYTKPRADFVGRFTIFNPFGQDYLDTKRKTLFKALHEGDKKGERVITKEIKREIVANLEQYEFPFKVLQKDKAKMIGMPYKTYKYHLTALKRGCIESKG